MSYQKFLKNKLISDKPTGLSQIPKVNTQLFDFQHEQARDTRLPCNNA